jgi:hypothetical protein
MDITKYRFDLVFSYWIFAWFLLYHFGITKYSPKLALSISLAENIILFLVMVFVLKSAWGTLLKFLIINTFIKVIPIYVVWADKINWKMDLLRVTCLFLIYIAWVIFYTTFDKSSQNVLFTNANSNIEKGDPNIYNAFKNILTQYRPGMLLYDDIVKYVIAL